MFNKTNKSKLNVNHIKHSVKIKTNPIGTHYINILHKT